MIRHVAVLRWNDTVTDDSIIVIGQALDGLPAAIPEIAVYRHGRDLQLAPTNADYVIVADFESVEDYLVYRDHPEHQRIIAELITDRASDRIGVQFEF
jgi:Stress responsive A/B Barrel Domain